MCYNPFTMLQFATDHVFILPHAEAYRRLYDISLADILLTLNKPEVREGLADDHYTVERSFQGCRVYLYYYVTFPLHGKKSEVYAIVDFIGYAQVDLSEEK